jgi:hypothetical protein
MALDKSEQQDNLVESREANALSKVTNPFIEPYPSWHQTYIDRLSSVLEYGLVAGDLSTRANIPADTTWRRPSFNYKYVSLYTRRSPEEIWSGRVGILVKLPEATELIHPESLILEEDDPYGYNPNEVLVKNRVAPREFVGLFIGSSIKPNDSTQVAPVSVKEILGQMEKLDPKRALPIYDNSGLVWPNVVSKEELVK